MLFSLFFRRAAYHITFAMSLSILRHASYGERAVFLLLTPLLLYRDDDEFCHHFD